MSALAAWLRPRRAAARIRRQEDAIALLIDAIVRTAAGEPPPPERHLRVIQGGAR